MKERSPITTHVLDISRGKAAAGVAVALDHQGAGGSWKLLGQGATNADGRVEDLLKPGTRAATGVYRLTFESEAYFRSSGTTSFYPKVEIIFQVTNPAEHHHVPLLLSPFGYSTYKGT